MISATDASRNLERVLCSKFTLGQDALIYNLRKNSHSWKFISEQFFLHYQLVLDEKTVSHRYEIVKGRTISFKLTRSTPCTPQPDHKPGNALNSLDYVRALRNARVRHARPRGARKSALRSQVARAEPRPRLVLRVSEQIYDSSSCAVESDSEMSLSDY